MSTSTELNKPANSSEIRLYTQEDLPQIIDIMAAIYGSDVAQAAKRRWQWQYHESPIAMQKGHAVYVLESEGKVQSVIGGMQQNFSIEGESIQGIWLVDFMARPDASPRAGMRLASAVTNHYPICLGQNSPTLNRYWRVVLKGNASDINKPTMMVKPLTIIPSLPVKYRQKAVVSLLARLTKSIVRAFYAEQGELNSSYQTTKVDKFDQRCNRLWEECCKSFQATAVRDQNYLNWRYCNSPLDYDCFQLEENGELKAWVVGRKYFKEGLWKARIVDYMAATNDKRSWNQLLFEICQFYRQQNVSIVQIINSQDPAIKQHIENNGFKPHANEKRLSPYIATVHKSHPLHEKINDGHIQWHLSYGDTDLDFY